MAKGNDREGQTVITPSGIMCFPHIWEPFAFKPKRNEEQKEKKYSLIIVFDEDEDLTEIQECAKRSALAKFDADDIKAWKKKGKWSWGIRDADDYDEYGFPFESGRKMIITNSNSAPGVVDERAKPIMKQQDVYSGCKIRVSLYAHAYDTNGNMGVTFLMNNVQKTGDGKPLGGGKADPTKEFSPVKGNKKASSQEDLEDLF